jgi:ribonucleoside-diphosphate reductase alpha chain
MMSAFLFYSALSERNFAFRIDKSVFVSFLTSGECTMTTAVAAPALDPATAKPAPTAAFTVIENVKGQRAQLAVPAYVNDEAIALSENSIKVLEKRYLRRDINGALLETPAGMFYRVAYHIAQVEKDHDGDVDGLTETFYRLLTERRFFPNSPTFTGAGTPLGQLAACFVLPIEDDMGKSSDGIFSTLRVAALIQQTGGGNGFSFSRLRPKNDVVHTSSGRATGPVGFLRVYDQAFGEIAQGGSRRGANMAVLRCDHPDIEDFITCKAEEGKVANFNISVAITDEFMQCCKEDSDFPLRNPRDGAVWKTVRARDLFDKIIQYAHHNGEPGALFIDAANRSNPVPHLYDLEATNPCGEQWLGPYENCCLGSINLNEHVTIDATGAAVVDWALLRRSTEESTHFLDNVVSANAYVPVVPQVAEAAHRARRIGLGIMGLGDMMYKLGIRYGSAEGQEFAAQIMEFVRYTAMQKSIALAEERGPFLAFRGSIYDDQQPGGMPWQPPTPLQPYTQDWGRPALDWAMIVADIRTHGIRNAAQTTVAPTGTIATVCGCEGYGCEPVFALGYVRHFKDGDKDVELNYTSPLFDAALDRSDLSERAKAALKQHAATYGSIQDLDDAPAAFRQTFVVSNDITAEEHVRMQAAIQAFVDNSISKTINFPEGATEADVAQAYQLAWELGCKGLTVYVTGSRQQVVLETKATKEKKGDGESALVPSVPTEVSNGYVNGHSNGHSNGHANGHSASFTSGTAPAGDDVKPVVTKRPRPKRLLGSTYRKDTPIGTAYITVNSDERSEPFEVFLNVGKAGSEVSAVSEAMGRLISLVLRMPASLPPSERLRWVMDEMAGIGGGRPLGFGVNRVRSLPDGIAQVIADYLSELPPSREEQYAEQLALPIAQRPIGDICPDCGEASFLNVEGCRKCHVCGYSEC